MASVIRNCKFCGKEYIVNINNRLYCSVECQRKNANILRKEYHKRTKKKKPENMRTIAEINRKASELGLNYGEYVAKYGV